MRRRSFGKWDGFKYGWLKDTKLFLFLLLAVFAIFRFVIGLSFVKGESMEPTLHDGEMVMYLRLSPGYHRGDVVSVRIQGGEGEIYDPGA